MNPATEEQEIRSMVERLLIREFPQIAMHGGHASVDDVNIKEGSVTISLHGSCDGCGISHMTIAALERVIMDSIPAIRRVYVHEGGWPQEFEPHTFGDVPF
jgi:Fe-S cluster biogenesis protein NfuA